MIEKVNKESKNFVKILEEIAQLESEIFMSNAYSFNTLLEMLTVFEEQYQCFYISKEERVCSYIVVLETVDSFEILKIASSKKFRCQGMGRKLLDAIHGKDIFLEVREKNTQAIAFYKNYGFQEIGKREHYYTDNQDNAIVMKMEGNYES